MKHFNLIHAFAMALLLTVFVPFAANSQCTNTSPFGTATAPLPPGSATTSGVYAGEYSTFNSLVVGTVYTVSTTIATDFITVRSGSSAGPVVAFGTQPLQFTATTAGTHYVHVNTNAACGTQNSGRTVTMSAMFACNNATANGTATAPVAPATSTITCQNAGEYGTWNSLVAGTNYQVTSTVATDFITIRRGTPNGFVVASGTQPLTFVATIAGTYYIHVNTNNACGTQVACRNITMSTVVPACTNTTAYGTQAAPTTLGGSAMIGCTYAGEYNTWTGLTAGVTYSLSSTVTTDYLTVRQGTSNGPVVAAGVQPLTFTATTAGTYYVHVNTNSSCGTVSGCRDITMTLPQPALDMSATALAAPLSTNCVASAETVTITITNTGSQAINFATTPVTVNASVSGPNAATFTPVVINSGTLASGATQNVNVATNYNMTAAGTYTFNASTSVTGDGFAANNNMAAVNIVVGSGTAAANNSNICNGSSVTLTLTGYTGTIQWQVSTDGGNTWANATGTGNTSATYTTSPTVNSMYRALVCGNPSNTTTVNVTTSPAPTVTGDTRCGAGVVNLSAAGTGTLQWYTVATGGTMVNTGATYSPTLSSTTTYYVSNTSGGTTGNVGMVSATTGAQQTSTNYLIFDVLSASTLVGVYVYPGAAGNVVLEHRTSAGTLITSATVAVTAGDVGQKTFIPLNFSLTPGTGYWLAQGAGSVSMFRNEFGVTYPYTLPGIVSITGSAAGPDYYYFSYDWIVSSGCQSARTPVTATVNPAPAITASSSTGSTVCSGNSTTLSVTSSNAGYSYTWSPATGLSATTGASVTASPSVATTYTVTASDASGCVQTQTLAIGVNQSPVVAATAAASTVCSGTPVQLNVTNTTPPAVYTVGTGNITNTSTSYPAPYGNYYWGARHQFLITAAELTASGMTAGPIQSLAFDVAALNNSQPLSGFEIKLGTTAITSITTFQTGLTSVFTSGAYSPATGWNTHMFSTPFTWNGTDNIIVETCFNNSSYLENVSVRQSTTSYTSSVYFYQDASGVCANNTVNGTMSQRPNMQFATPATFTYAWTPASSLDDATIANPLATPTVTTTYTAAVTYTQNGCVSTAPVTVTVNPLPTVTATSAASAICEGSSTTITAAGADTYTWTPATGLSATSGATVTANPTVTTTYTVSGTDVNGCVNTAPVMLTVNPLPVVTLAAINPVCVDAASFTLTGESPMGGTFSGTGVNGGMFEPATAGVGSHTVTYTYVDGNGCSSTANTAVTVNALPVVTLATPAPACSNGTLITLTGESPMGGTFSGMAVSNGMFDPMAAGVGSHDIVYSYTDANGCTSSDTASITVNTPPTVMLASMAPVCANAAMVTLGGESPAGGTFSGTGVTGNMFDPMVAGAGMHDIIYTFTDTNMCSNSDTAAVTVYAVPAVVLASQNAVCANGAAFTITGESPAGGTFSGTGVTGNMFDPMTAGAGMHDIIYTFTDTNMCSNSDTATVMVNANPVITLAAYTPVCEGSAMIALTGEAPAGGTYSGTAVSGNMFDPIAAGVGTHYVVYSYTDTNSCSAMDSAAIVVNANPIVNLGSDIVQCGGTVTLNAGNPGSTYVWSNNDSTQMITVATTGVISVTVDNNGCVASDTVSVTINQAPDINLGADVTLCEGENVILDAGAGFASYQWSNGPTTQTITVTGPGTFNVTVTAANGCQDSDTMTVTFDPCIGISEAGDSYVISVRPNPSEGMFNLVISGAEIAKLNVEILDIQGKLVYGFVENNISGDFNKAISLEKLAKGVYYLRMNTGSTIVTEKLVIQ